MRRDGEYTIYLIEGWDEEAQGWERQMPSQPEGFDACGDCWQTTGIHGTFDYDQALDGAGALQKKFGRPFRVVALEISQRVVVPPERIDRSGTYRPFPARTRLVLRAVLDLDDGALEKMFDLAEKIRRETLLGEEEDHLKTAARQSVEFEVPQRIRDLYGVREVMES